MVLGSLCPGFGSISLKACHEDSTQYRDVSNVAVPAIKILGNTRLRRWKHRTTAPILAVSTPATKTDTEMRTVQINALIFIPPDVTSGVMMTG